MDVKKSWRIVLKNKISIIWDSLDRGFTTICLDKLVFTQGIFGPVRVAHVRNEPLGYKTKKSIQINQIWFLVTYRVILFENFENRFMDLIFGFFSQKVPFLVSFFPCLSYFELLNLWQKL